MLSETFGWYPAGFDKSNFVFITPYESDRKKWSSLQGVNLVDGQSYQIAMQPSLYQDKVIPESFRILLRKYLGKPEVKSLAPDGTPCTATTRGLLQRARIQAGSLIPVGKETDRRWEQGEDPSMLDFGVHVYGNQEKMVVADAADRNRWRKVGVRELIRKSRLSQRAVYAILDGKPVRLQTFAIFAQAADELTARMDQLVFA
jgi:hypothetical protein